MSKDNCTIYIGRDRDSDIVIDKSSISRQHATISCNNGEYRIQDNNSLNGVYVNGQKVSHCVIASSDTITLGTSELLDWDKIQSAYERKASGYNQPYVHIGSPSSKDSISIGRSSDNDIVINDPTISKHHAAIKRTFPTGSGISYNIEDLNSQNGIYVNGEKVTNGRISSTDVITLGSQVVLSWDHIKSAFNKPSQAYSTPSSTLSITIGRTPDNDIVINEPKVSKHHAVIHSELLPDRQTFTIEDTNSQNGVFVNGVRVKSQRISPSDSVTVGTNHQLNWNLIATAISGKQANNEINYVKDSTYIQPEGVPVYPDSVPYYDESLNQPPRPKSNSSLLVAGIIGVLVIIVGLAIFLSYGRGAFSSSTNRQVSQNQKVSLTHKYSIINGESKDIALRRAKIEAQRELLEKTKSYFPNSNNFATNYSIFDIQVSDQSITDEGQSVVTEISTEMNQGDFEAKMSYLSTNQDLYDRLNSLQIEYDANYSLVVEAESNMIQSYKAYQESGDNQSGYSTGYEPANNYEYYQERRSSAEQYYNDCVSTYMEQLDGVEQSIVQMDEPKIALQSIKSEIKISEGKKPSLFDRVANMFTGAVSIMSPSSGPVDALLAWKSTSGTQSSLQFYETKHGSRALAAKWYPQYEMDAETNEAINNLVQEMDLESSNIEKLKKSDYQVEYCSGDIARITIKSDAVERISRGSSAIMDRAVEAGLEGGLEYLRQTDPDKYAEKVKEKAQFSEKLKQEMRNDLGGDLNELWEEAWGNTVYYMIKENGSWKRYLYEDDSELQKFNHYEEQMQRLNNIMNRNYQN